MKKKVLEEISSVEPKISEKGEIFFPISMNTKELDVFFKAMNYYREKKGKEYKDYSSLIIDSFKEGIEKLRRYRNLWW